MEKSFAGRKVDLMVSDTEVAGIQLEHPLMNAAGTCKSLEDVKKLARSSTAAIMVGSGTVEERGGNEGEVYWYEPMFSLNAWGLPNPGAVKYRKMLPEMVDVAHSAGKPLFMSVAGFSPAEYADLAEMVLEGGVDFVELNLGCPNVWHDGEQKRIVSFDTELDAEVLHCVEQKVGFDAKVGVKLSPFSDPFVLGRVAAVLSSSRLVKVVTSSNTFPNAFAFNGTRPAITFGEGLAGFAGPAMKSIALGQVRQLRNLLPERIQIIGVGGITKGVDIREYQDSGVVATQVATAYFQRGEKVFSDLLTQYVETEEEE